MNELQMKIIYYKKKLGLKNKDISERTGLPVDTISRICTGKTRDPKYTTVKLIADAFDCSVDDLVGNDEAVEPYYFDKKTAELAQELKGNTELKILLDSTRDLTPEDLKTVIDMVKMLKRN